MLIPNVNLKEGEKGPWKIKKFTVDKDDMAMMIFNMKNPRRSMRAGNYTQLEYHNQIMMSDTPAEKDDHTDFVRVARDKVLIHGLGLAMVANACALKEEVKSVTVMEISQDLIDLIGENELHPKIKIIKGDAYTYKWPKGTYFDFVWHDIWLDICEDNLEGIGKLHRKWGKRCYFQDSWCKTFIQARRRERKQNRW